jgi:hypothetical protein
MNNNLNHNDPDYHIELFWFGFKQSMINFYQYINMKYDHIQKWSDKLNQLKSNKEYLEIEKNIREYMTYYSFDLLNNNTSYYDNILVTNIKRWNNISIMFNFKPGIYSKIIIILLIYLEIKKLDKYDFLEDIFQNKNNNSFHSILEDNTILLRFIKFAVLYNKPKILNLLKKIPNYNIIDDINKLYPNIIIDNNITMIKLIRLLQNITK